MIARFAIGVLLFLLSVYTTCSIREDLRLSALLDSLAITFEDLDPEYTKALNLSVSQGTPLQYPYPSSEPKIPRIIHRILLAAPSQDGVTRTTWSPLIAAGDLASYKEQSPNYTIHTWNPETGYRFLEENYQWFLATYNGYAFPTQRADALKYFLLWHYGGVYLDHEIDCRRSLDPLLDFSAWISRGDVRLLGVNTHTMASKPGHPLFGEIIQSLHEHDHYYLFPILTIFWSTGRGFVNSMLKEYWSEGDGTRDRSPLDVANNQKSLKANLIDGTDQPYQYSGTGDIAVLPQIFYDGEFGFFDHHRPGHSLWRYNGKAVWAWEGIGILIVASVLYMSGILGNRRARSDSIADPKSQPCLKTKSMVC